MSGKKSKLTDIQKAIRERNLEEFLWVTLEDHITRLHTARTEDARDMYGPTYHYHATSELRRNREISLRHEASREVTSDVLTWLKGQK